jgi:hypothetical protein
MRQTDDSESSALYRDSQRCAARERLLAEAAGRMSKSLDLETVLKTTADELFQALGLEEVVVSLAVDKEA